MGMPDTINGESTCPYCNEEISFNIQTKALRNTLSDKKVGDRLINGPYLNGYYCRHKETCMYCKNEIFPAYSIEYPLIKNIKIFKKKDCKKKKQSLSRRNN